MSAAYENIIREERERQVAADPEATARHEQLSSAWRDMHRTTSTIFDTLAEAQETRRQWVMMTEPARQAAVAADHELRRRHPGQDSRQSPGDSDRTSGAVEDTSRPVGSGVVPGAVGDVLWDGVVQRIRGLSQNARAAQAKLDELARMRIPRQDADAADLGPARTISGSRDGAILQPARPGLVPASEVLWQAEARRSAATSEAENA